MDKDTALKLALEALQWNWGGEPLPTLELQAINAIKEALAQSDQESDDLTIAYMTGFHAGKNTLQRKPDQEPVANGIIRTLVSIDKDGIETWKHEPFYTAPPKREWVGLTDEDTSAAWDAMKTYDDFDTYAKVIEAKLREKNSG